MTSGLFRESAAARFLRREGTLAGVGAEPEGSDDPDLDLSYVGGELARNVGLSPADESALATLAAMALAGVQSGSTRWPIALSELEGAAGAAVAQAAHALLERAASADATDPVRRVIGRVGERKPLLLDQGWLYLERMHVLEERFCKHVCDRVSKAIDAPEPRTIRRTLDALEKESVRLSREQRVAIEEGLRRPLSLISGGPGTGKTTVIASLIHAATWIGAAAESVALAAPTGKATQRLADAMARALTTPTSDMAFEAARRHAPAPITLHRLLGWSPARRRFAYHENNRLPQRCVIVDEASMIDLMTMGHLFRALRDDARLVLVGDANQLPSVDAGAAFRDLCASLGCTRLLSNYRVAASPSAQQLVAAAESVNRGALGEAVSMRRSPDAMTVEGVEHLDARWSDVHAVLLDRWWDGHVGVDARFLARASRTYQWSDGALVDDGVEDLSALFALYAKSRLLCATRSQGSPASADSINRVLLQRLRDHGLGFRSWRVDGLSLGAPVMVSRNDYRHGLYNGDQGVIVRGDTGDGSGPRPLAVFHRPDGFAAFALDGLTDLAPAFAMTVHKAQGSEFDDIVLVLPELDLPLCTREIVYTAITRARRSAWIVASAESLGRALSRVSRRYSGVVDRLAGLRTDR